MESFASQDPRPYTLYFVTGTFEKRVPVAFFFLKDQRRKDGSNFEPDTVFTFQKTPTSHKVAKTYSDLSFD